MDVPTTMRTGVLLGAMAVAVACSGPPATAGAPGAVPDARAETRHAALGDTIHIQLGQTASVDNGRLALTFRSHGTDSRCPATVVCVWMGDVPVRIAARAGGTVADVELHTGVEPRTVAVDRYVVKLLGMLPYPGTTPEGQQPTPTAVLVVTSR